MPKYTINVDGRVETHSNKDDVIIALLAYLNGYNIPAGVRWPDGFFEGVEVGE